jgi:undecaprenyl diphosphate synthase
MKNAPVHIASIMDGNGRWAKRRGLARTEGHRRGMAVLRETIEAARHIAGVKFLTLYAFSTENWRRSTEEVSFLMKMCEAMVTKELPMMIKNNIRFRHIGRLEGLPESLQRVIENAQSLTRNNHKFSLQLAFNYGGRSEIVDAVKKIVSDATKDKISVTDITEDLISSSLYTKDIPDPDLLIRTSGEMRVSNFLLWQIGYSEIYVTKKFWPDFSKRELLRAVSDYQKRKRRFGSAS